MSAEQITATANGLSLFQGFEFFLIVMAIIGLVLIIFLGPKILDKRYRFKMAELNKDNQQMEIETNALVKEVADRFTRLETDEHGLTVKVDRLFDIVSNLDELLGKTSEGTLENMLFNDSEYMSVFKRLKAYKRLIAMGKNGKIKAKGFKLILENKDIWLAVQETELNLKIVDQKYFDSVMEEIDKHIFHY